MNYQAFFTLTIFAATCLLLKQTKGPCYLADQPKTSGSSVALGFIFFALSSFFIFALDSHLMGRVYYTLRYKIASYTGAPLPGFLLPGEATEGRYHIKQTLRWVTSLIPLVYLTREGAFSHIWRNYFKSFSFFYFPRALFRLILWSSGSFALSVSASAFAGHLLTGSTLTQSVVPSPSLTLPYYLFLLNTCLIAPIVEELLFRRLLLSWVLGYLPLLLSLSLTSFLFAFAFSHASFNSFSFDWITTREVVLFTLGIWWGLCYVRESLLMVILVNGSYNFFATWYSN